MEMYSTSQTTGVHSSCLQMQQPSCRRPVRCYQVFMGERLGSIAALVSKLKQLRNRQASIAASPCALPTLGRPLCEQMLAD